MLMNDMDEKNAYYDLKKSRKYVKGTDRKLTENRVIVIKASVLWRIFRYFIVEFQDTLILRSQIFLDLFGKVYTYKFTFCYKKL